MTELEVNEEKTVKELPKVMLNALNIGSGSRIFKSHAGMKWVNLDNSEMGNPDVIRDIRRGLPFNDKTFDLILCCHVLEHFGGEDLVFIMDEIHRVLVDNGELVIYSPYYKHFGAYQDPHHKVFLSEHGFDPWFYPALSSHQIGVKRFFYPVIIDYEDGAELRVVMKTVPIGALDSYCEKVGVKKDGRDYLIAPDWLKNENPAINVGRTLKWL